MTPEHKAKINALRERLKTLTPDDRQQFINRGLVSTIDGHPLSITNTILVYLQSGGQYPTIVGGFQQWRRAGKCVKRGQHGMTIWFPVGSKDADGNIIETTKFYTTTVFDITQVEELNSGSKPAAMPEPVKPEVTIIEPVKPEPINPAPVRDDIMAGFQLI